MTTQEPLEQIQAQMISVYQLLLDKYHELWETNLLLTQLSDQQQIDSITQLIDRREAIIQELTPLAQQKEELKQFLSEFGNKSVQDAEAVYATFTGLEKQIDDLIKQILNQDKVIHGKLTSQIQGLKSELSKFNQAKQAKQGYQPMYSPDAIFFDKKK